MGEMSYIREAVVQVIFQDMAQGERKLLQHRFRSLVHGCEAVYRERLHAAQEHKDGD